MVKKILFLTLVISSAFSFTSCGSTPPSKEYTITWNNYDGSLLSTTKVKENETPVYDKGTPTREPTEEYIYTFSGWSPEIVPAVSDATYTATYASEKNCFTITWKNYDGTILETDNDVPYGATPKYDGLEPVRPSTAQYIYTFKGWSPEVAPVTGDQTYVAEFTDTLQKYTITWKNWDGSVLETDINQEYGKTPKYDGATPTKPSTPQAIYAFKGWSPEVKPVEGNQTYIAQFSNTLQKYTITWKNYDGTTLETDTNQEYGKTPTYDGATPTRPEDAQYTYKFNNKWSPEVSKVVEDQIYVAQYDTTLRTYTITWKNWDGSVLETDNNVPYGTTPSYDGATPTKPSTQEAIYAFKGWSPEVKSVEGNQTYIAQFSNTLQKYTITWKNYDGTVLETDKDQEYGTNATYNGSTPTKPADVRATYTFSGWSPTVGKVVDNQTYIALFSETINTYKVTWMGGIDGKTLLKEETLEYGASPNAPTMVPQTLEDDIYTYTFSNWSPTVVPVTGAATYIAQYVQSLKSFNITWKNYDSTTLKEDKVLYGHIPVYSGAIPTKKIGTHNFEWIGWDKEVVAAASDATYTAKFYDKISFTFEGTNCLINGWEYFTDVYDFAENSITYTIIPVNTYSLPESVEVYVDGVSVSSKYTYNSSTGVFSIPANLGDVKLVAKGVAL